MIIFVRQECAIYDTCEFKTIKDGVRFLMCAEVIEYRLAGEWKTLLPYRTFTSDKIWNLIRVNPGIIFRNRVVEFETKCEFEPIENGALWRGD